jgi:hypothetical protein
MDVELRYVRECPNLAAVEQRLLLALEAVGQPNVRIRHRLVHDETQAQKLRFTGSPTIVIDGSDPFPEPNAAVGMSCRLYRTDQGMSGSPSTPQLIAALNNAAPK